MKEELEIASNSCPFCGSVGHKGEDCSYNPNKPQKKEEREIKKEQKSEKEIEDEIRAKLKGGGYEEMTQFAEFAETESKPASRLVSERTLEKEEITSEADERIESVVRRISYQLSQDVEFAKMSATSIKDRQGKKRLAEILGRYIAVEKKAGNIRDVNEWIKIVKGLDIAIPLLAGDAEDVIKLYERGKIIRRE